MNNARMYLPSRAPRQQPQEQEQEQQPVSQLQRYQAQHGPAQLGYYQQQAAAPEGNAGEVQITQAKNNGAGGGSGPSSLQTYKKKREGTGNIPQSGTRGGGYGGAGGGTMTA